MPLDLEVEEIEIRLILEAIHARYGYDLSDYLTSSMRRRVLAAFAKTGAVNLGDLQHRLLGDPALFASVLDHLMVQVSEMFRDPSFFLAFRREIVPLLKTYPQLKVWHAGCASGEEVYSTAILLAEEGLYDRTQIYATDLSLQALERAREGVYPVELASHFSDNYRAAGGTGAFETYVTAAYDRIAVKEALRRNVVFFQHNLVSDQPPGEMNVIFCRNVLIYFGPELRRRVVTKFGDGLCRGGFLCLGMSELLPVAPDGSTSFREHVPHQRIYRKG
jgi:chemotaxis protein methyltransferase CheR